MKLKGLRTRAEINLDNFVNNINVIKNHVGSDVKLMAVIKADGYGHGAVRLAREALEAGVSWLAVACISEAIELRKAGVTAPILILSHICEEIFEDIIDYDVIPGVFNTILPEKLNILAKEKGKTVKVHIKLDTGMTRLGFDSSDIDGTVKAIEHISDLSNIEIDGVFTHFADADNEFGDYTEAQYKKYLDIISALSEKGIEIPIKHVCNSAASIAEKSMQLDVLRCGIMIYGYYPEEYLEKIMPGLKPVMEIKSHISQIKEVKKDITVSYGRTYKTDENKRIGVVPIGYADGYSRNLSNNFYMLVCGKRANILGRVCMDQLMIDLTEIDEAYEGCEVTVLGKDGDEIITADHIAKKLNTISYEILCDVSRRVPRVYLKHGEIDSYVNYLE